MSYEIYRGPSLIDGGPIVAIITNDSKNIKTGNQSQIWILCTEDNPLMAVDNETDSHICGDCKHRGSTCYVALHMAPLAIYRAWLKGNYPKAENLEFLRGKSVRFGAYGDGAALPLSLIRNITRECKGWTGYTHQWAKSRVQPYQKYFMASVDSIGEYLRAKKLGWRTFRVKTANSNKLKQEIVCPASQEGGYKSNCFKCGLCSGLRGKGRKDIVINIHGLAFKQKRFNRMSLTLV